MNIEDVFEFLNINKNGLELFKKNIEKINWKILSSNKNALELLKEYPEKIDYFNLSKNKGIFIKNTNIKKKEDITNVLSIILIS